LKSQCKLVGFPRYICHCRWAVLWYFSLNIAHNWRGRLQLCLIYWGLVLDLKVYVDQKFSSHNGLVISVLFFATFSFFFFSYFFINIYLSLCPPLFPPLTLQPYSGWGSLHFFCDTVYSLLVSNETCWRSLFVICFVSLIIRSQTWY